VRRREIRVEVRGGAVVPLFWCFVSSIDVAREKWELAQRISRDFLLLGMEESVAYLYVAA